MTEIINKNENNIHILKAENFQKTYGKKKIVKNISLTIKSNEIVGILGPNGAGKTTFFYMIVGIIPIDYGYLFVDNHDITNLAIYERAKYNIGYLPQESSIFRNMTTKDNIKAILQLKYKDKKVINNKLDELLEDFSITHIADSNALSLSGGERRRVEIARCLAMDPKFILLDEPFAGIDPIAVADIMDIIQKLKQKNIAILITDHNIRETLSIVDRSYIIYNGEILASGNKDDIYKNKDVRKVYLGDKFTM